MRRGSLVRVRASASDVFVIDESCLYGKARKGTRDVHEIATRALRSTRAPFYVLTESDPKQCTVDLKRYAGIEVSLDSNRIFRCVEPHERSVSNALQDVSERPLLSRPGTRGHYLGTRAHVLGSLSREPKTSEWKLYLAGWAREDDKKDARDLLPGSIVPTVQEPQLAELLDWGLLQGVDDGCEPTMEEVLRGVQDS